jgi:aspartate beta-hydroxylase
MLPAVPLKDRPPIRDKLWAWMAARYDRAELRRIGGLLEIWCHERTPSFLPRQQMRVDNFMPDLPTTPWLDATRYSFQQELEARYEDITREYVEASRQHDLTYYLAAGSGMARPVPGHPVGWKELLLFRQDRLYKENADRCPTLRDVYSRLLAQCRQTSQVCFLVLEPGTHLPDHVDPCNWLVELQMGIFVPQGDCFLQVAGTSRQWVEGRCLSFDNSFLHTAWNKTEQRRVILSFHLPHPALTSVELQVLAWIRDVFLPAPTADFEHRPVHHA